MFKSRFLHAVLAAVIVIGLLAVGGLAIYRTGWAQGYMSAQEAGVGVDSAIPPRALFHPGWRFGRAPFAMGGRAFLIVGVLFLIFLVIKSFCFRAYRMSRGPMGMPWAEYRRWHHGPMRPWCWGWERPPEEKAEKDEKAEPDWTADDAATAS